MSVRSVVCGFLGALALASTAQADSWVPDYNMGPIVFGEPLPEGHTYLARTPLIRNPTIIQFALQLPSGAVISGFEQIDPRSRIGRRAVLNMWTDSPGVAYRGVGVGSEYSAAKKLLGKKWDRESFCRRNLHLGGDDYSYESPFAPAADSYVFFDKKTNSAKSVQLTAGSCGSRKPIPDQY